MIRKIDGKLHPSSTCVTPRVRTLPADTEKRVECKCLFPVLPASFCVISFSSCIVDSIFLSMLMFILISTLRNISFISKHPCPLLCMLHFFFLSDPIYYSILFLFYYTYLSNVKIFLAKSVIFCTIDYVCLYPIDLRFYRI